MLRSMQAQTTAVLILGLLLSALVGYALYIRDRQSAILLTEVFDLAERAAGIGVTLQQLPSDWTPEIIRASDSRAFRVWTASVPIVTTIESAEDQEITAYLRTLFPDATQAEVRAALVPSSTTLAVPVRPGTETVASRDPSTRLAISLPYDSGTWLNMLGDVSTNQALLPRFLVLNLVMVTLFTAAIGFWLVRRVTTPLYLMSEAARRFGRDINAPPLPVTGPSEVRTAAQAFNEMQQRLAKVVSGRTEMLAAISHDLRTPITQMRLRTELRPAGEDRDKTLVALDEMSQIITVFLDFARASNASEDRRMVDIGSLVESICDDFSDSGHQVDCTVEGCPRIWCKRLGLKRAVTNIVENAIRYGEKVNVSVSEHGNKLSIRVEDDGPGIPPRSMQDVFEPFTRLESSRNRNISGTGLGLSIARSIVEDHQGMIRLENRPSGGLRVSIDLPGDRQDRHPRET